MCPPLSGQHWPPASTQTPTFKQIPACRHACPLQLPYASVLVVAQAHSLLTQAFDSVDVVVKVGGHSRVEQGSAAVVS